MEVSWSGSREELISSSSIATKSHRTPIWEGPRRCPEDDITVFDAINRHKQTCNLHKIQRAQNDHNLELATQALNFYNQNSPWNFQLLKLGGHTRVVMKRGMILHMNFTAKNTHVAAAPDEMFFTEMTNSSISGVSVRLCVSLGPINSFSVSGSKLNGCYYCRGYNKVWHPKGGGFIRGADDSYKTVQDICDTNQNNAIPEYEMQLARLKQDSLDPKKDREYISQEVDGECLYASEALKDFNQNCWRKYELVNPGLVTRVVLPTCLLFHVNFEAKETDVVTAPEEMFFAELTDAGGVLSCKRCIRRKPGDLIKARETGDMTNGCYFCQEFNNVYHPRSGHFVRGGDSLYKLENELE